VPPEKFLNKPQMNSVETDEAGFDSFVSLLPASFRKNIYADLERARPTDLFWITAAGYLRRG
jgi:hypothetical protein